MASATKRKVFNDPVHGHISIHPLCVKIIDTPQFQRLRDIKELWAVQYVYPGATHTCFEHSIGACHLAEKWTRHLLENFKEERPELAMYIEEKDILCVMIAALCHDLGHAPFSYGFKYYLQEKRKEMKQAEQRETQTMGIQLREPLQPAQDVLNDEKDVTETKVPTVEHYKLSCDMFTHLITENGIDKEMQETYKFEPQDFEVIKSMIQPEGIPPTEETSTPKERAQYFLYQIVRNFKTSIDVNKWDSLARDSLHLNTTNPFDFKRLVEFSKVLVHKKGHTVICFRDKEIENILKMFEMRYDLHRQAYKHRVTHTVNIMLGDALLKADGHFALQGKGKKIDTLMECCTDLVAFGNLTDSIINQIKWFEPNDNLREAKQLLENIQKRRLYKSFRKQPRKDMTHDEFMKTFESEDSARTEILRNANKDLPFEEIIEEKDVVVHLLLLKWSEDDANPASNVDYYDKESGVDIRPMRPYKDYRLSPSAFTQRLVCVTYRKRDPSEDKCQLLRQAFTQWFEDKGLQNGEYL